MDTLTPSATALLGWPIDRASALFPGQEPDRTTRFRRLLKTWHPDHNTDPRAHEVFIRLRELYAACTSQQDQAVVQLTSLHGKTFRFQGCDSRSFALGRIIRGKTKLAYFIEPAHRNLFEQFVATTRHFTMANDNMRQQMQPALPLVLAAEWGHAGGLLVLARDNQGICLHDLITWFEQHGQTLDPRHAGWMLNSLFNLACYLEYAGIAHHGIDASSVWIKPKTHAIELLGGWFYASPFGQAFNCLPASTHRVAPRSYLVDKCASGLLDLESIMALGRVMMGDASGMRMKGPKPLLDFLKHPPHGSALEQYKHCKKALLASFGAPSFVPMDISSNDIYQGE